MYMEQTAMGPAERILQAVTTYTDHLHHGRPGCVVKDPHSVIGVKWLPVTTKKEGDDLVVYHITKVGRKSSKSRLGVKQPNGQVKNGPTLVGEFRDAGVFKEAAGWLYQQVADVWQLDNEFAARWASWAFQKDSRDLKTLLAAFMLVQARAGAPVMEAGERLFNDEDYRAVGEAMLLIHTKDRKGLDPKMLLRVYDILSCEPVAAINRKLGFGRSARRPALGRWERAVHLWLQHREQNLPLLQGLVKAGFRKTVKRLAIRSGYKPETAKFFEVLRWRQVQAKDGRRQLAIGAEVSAAESWAALSEAEICQKIVADRPSFKRISGMVPKGVTRAIMAAAIEAKCLSDKDLVIATPTLEELGLLEVPEIRTAWEQACSRAEDARAANIAKNIRSKETREKLEQVADEAVKRVVAEATKGLRIYVIVDVSVSLEGAIETAKQYVPKFIQAFLPAQGASMDKCPVHVAVFNTTGRVVRIPHPSERGVAQAFSQIRASGGTSYGAGVSALAEFKPTPEEDALMVFVGDEEQHGDFSAQVRNSGINPVAFGLIRVLGTSAQQTVSRYGAETHEATNKVVRETAAILGIPCFRINPETFQDVYAIPQTIRNLVAATPVGVRAAATQVTRVTLVDQILKTELLKKPVWAVAA
jgi:hypothetical protein